MSKKITDNQILGERGVNFIQRIVLEMGFTWHPSNQPVEAGIDGWVELRDKNTGEVKNTWIAVQSKAVSEPNESESFVKYTPKLKDVEYWLKGNQPVVLVVAVPGKGLGWWISVKDYYAGKNISKERQIVFDKTDNALDEKTCDVWKSLSEACGGAAYFTPIRQSEELHSNLLKVWRWGETVFTRQSVLKNPKDISDNLREHVDWAPREWFLGESNMIYSFHDLSDSLWNDICEGETKSFKTDDWAFSQVSTDQKSFVRLMNQCFRQLMGRHRIRYSNEEDCYYFLPERNRVIRTLKYKSHKQVTSRGVVKKYMGKLNKEKIAYYRHDAFQHRFLRLGDCWFLMIQPDYYFTTDGTELDPFREEHKAGIKKLEGDAAVSGTIVMITALLNEDKPLFEDAYPFLSFDRLETATVDAGIDDEAWARIKKADEILEEEAENEFAKGLFD